MRSFPMLYGLRISDYLIYSLCCLFCALTLYVRALFVFTDFAHESGGFVPLRCALIGPLNR